MSSARARRRKRARRNLRRWHAEGFPTFAHVKEHVDCEPGRRVTIHPNGSRGRLRVVAALGSDGRARWKLDGHSNGRSAILSTVVGVATLLGAL